MLHSGVSLFFLEALQCMNPLFQLSPLYFPSDFVHQLILLELHLAENRELSSNAMDKIEKKNISN